MNILVIKQSSLGDVLHSTAALRAIKDGYPQSHLTVLTNRASAPILVNNPDIDALICFDYARVKAHWRGSPKTAFQALKQTIRQVRQQHYDLAFDLQGLGRSVLFLYAAKAERKFVKGRWLGLGKFRNKNLHAIDEMAGVLNLAGIPMASKQMHFQATSEDRSKLAQLRAAQHQESSAKLPLIVVSPFTRWPSKNWPLASFVQLAQQLTQLDATPYEVVLTGTQEDEGAIATALAGNASPRLTNLAGKLSLAQLSELMRGAALVISGDSFPMHLASAVDTPLIALFGPTDETKTGPLGPRAVVLRPTQCNRCDDPRCAQACLGRITVSRVRDAAKALLLGGG